MDTIHDDLLITHKHIQEFLGQWIPHEGNEAPTLSVLSYGLWVVEDIIPCKDIVYLFHTFVCTSFRLPISNPVDHILPTLSKQYLFVKGN